MSDSVSKREQLKADAGRIDTTIGELIEAITEIALEAGKSEQEGYQLASLTLENILRKNIREESVLN